MCGGIFNKHFIANCLQNTPMKETFGRGRLKNMQINFVSGVRWHGTFFSDSPWPIKAIKATNVELHFFFWGGWVIHIVFWLDYQCIYMPGWDFCDSLWIVAGSLMGCEEVNENEPTSVRPGCEDGFYFNSTDFSCHGKFTFFDNHSIVFLRATASTALTRFSHCNSARHCVTRMDQSKTVHTDCVSVCC